MISDIEREEIKKQARKTAKIISMIISGLPALLIAFVGYTFMAGCVMTSFLPLTTVNFLAPWIGGAITILVTYSAYLEHEEKLKRKIPKRFKVKKTINLKK